MMVVNNPLIRPYFLGGVALGGVPLDCHDDTVDGNQKSGVQQLRLVVEIP